MEGPVANVAEQEPLLAAGLATVLAPLAFLALPAHPDDGSDLDVFPGVEVVLAADRAEQKVLELFWGELVDPAVFPGVAIVVQVQ